MRGRSETPQLASDVRDLMPIHQGEPDGVEPRHHLGPWREANTAALLPEGHLPAKVGDAFPRPKARQFPAQDGEGNSAFARDLSSQRPPRRCACLGLDVRVACRQSCPTSPQCRRERRQGDPDGSGWNTQACGHGLSPLAPSIASCAHRLACLQKSVPDRGGWLESCLSRRRSPRLPNA